MDNKSSPKDRKVSFIAPLIIGLVLAVIFGTILIRPAPPPPAPAPVKPVPAPVAAAIPPVSKPAPAAPLNRAELILQAQRAMSEFAATGKLSPDSSAVVGRRFSLHIPFGCNGANGAMLNPQAAVTYDAEQKSLTVTAQPALWDSLPVIQPLLESGAVETVEGFWLPRPWTVSEDCPPASTSPAPAIATPATAQTLGLAQLFEAGGARTRRHYERPYSITRKLGANEFDLLTHAYRLVLEGAISGYPDGQALRCWAEASDHQPTCIFAVTLSHVALEDAAGAVLAEWSD